MNKGRIAFAQQYDVAIFDPASRALYDGSGFYNVGLWSNGPSGPPRGLGEAARRLVELHLSVDTEEEAARASLVLDVGCGLGATTDLIARHYQNALVLGVNLSPVQARHASQAAAAARFAVMDAAGLAVASESVDRLHCVEAAFHFHTRDAFLGEAFRVLRPGGKVVLTDIRFTKGYKAVPQANIFTDEADYRGHCLEAGFQIDRLDDITAETLVPLFAFLEARGRTSEAAVLRVAQDKYYFAVLRKP